MAERDTDAYLIFIHISTSLSQTSLLLFTIKLSELLASRGGFSPGSNFLPSARSKALMTASFL